MKTFLLCMTALSSATAHTPALADEGPHDGSQEAVARPTVASREMAFAARDLLASLAPEQRAKALFSFEDAERRNWHFVPRERRGLPLKEMTPEQRLLAHALLSCGLSQRGYSKALAIMSLESVLAEIERGQGALRDAEMYFFSLFGQPGGREPWGWRVEGHHLSLNFSSVGGGQLAAAPSFFGSNPARVLSGPRQGFRALPDEEDLARELVRSLDDKQRAIAIVASQAPADISSLPGREVSAPAQGLRQSQMKPAQKALLEQLVRVHLGRHQAAIAQAQWRKIQKAGLEKVHFAWAGGLEPRQGHYYRVQGPTFVLEYDNTQNGANHVHSVWRDIDGDFGADLLKEHYQKAHAR